MNNLACPAGSAEPGSVMGSMGTVQSTACMVVQNWSLIVLVTRPGQWLGKRLYTKGVSPKRRPRSA